MANPRLHHIIAKELEFLETYGTKPETLIKLLTQEYQDDLKAAANSLRLKYLREFPGIVKWLEEADGQVRGCTTD